MTSEIKPDAALFRQRIQQLKAEKWLSVQQRWWADYAFHFTDIVNVVSILKTNELVCRSMLSTRGAEFTDSASPDIIEQTVDKWKNHVRLYFRPRTPMLYTTEGFRPSSRVQLKAHCPVPVYLLFDLEGLLCRSDSAFSYGSLASRSAESYTTAHAFQSLPFQQVYHDSWLSEEEKSTITYHRHAELVVPDRIGLNYLRYIWCRSQAEYETLRYLLPQDIWNRWRERIVARSDRQLFFRRWCHVRQATLTRSQIVFEFNQPKDDADRGPFDVSVAIDETITGRQYLWSEKRFVVRSNSLIIDLSNLDFTDDYALTLTFNGQLAYKSRFQDTSIPF